MCLSVLVLTDFRITLPVDSSKKKKKSILKMTHTVTIHSFLLDHIHSGLQEHMATCSGLVAIPLLCTEYTVKNVYNTTNLNNDLFIKMSF